LAYAYHWLCRQTGGVDGIGIAPNFAGKDMSRTGTSWVKRGMLAAAFGLLILALAWQPVFADDEPPNGSAGGQEDAPPPPPPERESEDPHAVPDRPSGYDRPLPYPRIRFSPRREEDEEPRQGEVVNTRSRVYLLDVSEAMSASITIDNTTETTRLEHMSSLVERSLEALSRRRGLHFNLITFGTPKDLAEGGNMLEAGPESTQRAVQWLRNLEVGGSTDIYGMLKSLFDQRPDSATMLVGSMPARPADVDDAVLAEHDSVQDFLVAEVERWRAGGGTSLDITGIGLDAQGRAFYRRLAQAGGGTYMDG
jgi:hypothetical protein